MTNEDKKIVADYMGWIFSEYGGEYYYIPKNGKVIYFDINDASLVVAEMQKRGEWVDFRLFAVSLWMNCKSDCEDITAWIFIADNFFSAFAQWRKTK